MDRRGQDKPPAKVLERAIKNAAGGNTLRDREEITSAKAAKRAKREDVQAAKFERAAETAAGAAAASAALSDSEWHYEDASQQLQGPYPLSSMQEWFASLPLNTRVRRGAGGELFELRHAAEIAGLKVAAKGEATAPQLTAVELKTAGNAHLAAGRLTEAIAAYSSALELTPAGDDDNLRGAVLSNRSGAHLLNESAEAATADARQCVEARPDWPKAHWRLSVALTATMDLSGALVAANNAEMLDATPAHAEAKRSAVDLLRKEVKGMEKGPDRESRELLLQKFRDPTGDSEIRQRRKKESAKVAKAAAKQEVDLDEYRLNNCNDRECQHKHWPLDLGVLTLTDGLHCMCCSFQCNSTTRDGKKRRTATRSCVQASASRSHDQTLGATTSGISRSRPRSGAGDSKRDGGTEKFDGNVFD